MHADRSPNPMPALGTTEDWQSVRIAPWANDVQEAIEIIKRHLQDLDGIIAVGRTDVIALKAELQQLNSQRTRLEFARQLTVTSLFSLERRLETAPDFRR